MGYGEDRPIYKSRYVRPNRTWVCGHEAEGRPCALGPNLRGKCAGSTECIPTQVGERWVCTRPDMYGGPCDRPDAPEPSFGPIVVDGVGVCCRKKHCVPVRSQRAQRGVVATVVTSITIAAVLIVLGGPWRNWVLSPGELTISHQGASFGMQSEMAQIMADNENPGGENCNACHDPALQRGPESLILAALTSDMTSVQSHKCRTCHEELGANAMYPHSLAPDQLEAITASVTDPQQPSPVLNPGLALAALWPQHQPNEELACAICHHEHRGLQHNLSQMTNAQCQSCHTEQFQSFERGHPTFGVPDSRANATYPFARRTRIIFDHQRHENRHFADSNPDAVPESCTDCHEPTQDGRFMGVRSFEVMCASCHQGDIVNIVGDGTNVLGYPTLDKPILFDFGIPEDQEFVENFPEVKDTKLSPFIGFFASLTAEHGGTIAEDLQLVADKFANDMSFLSEEESELEAAARVAQQVDALFNALGAPSESAVLEQAIRDTLGSDAKQSRLNALLGPLADNKPLGDILDSVAEEDADVVATGGWSVKEAAPRTLGTVAWENLAESAPGFEALAAAAPEGNPFPEWFTEIDSVARWFNGRVQVAEGRWLVRGGIGDVGGGDWEEFLEAAPGYSALADAADTLPEDVQAFLEWFEEPDEVRDWLTESVRIAESGWYPADAPRALQYRPVGHADPFIQAWLELSGTQYDDRAAARILFDQLAGRADVSSAMGQCTKCHSVETRPGDAGVAANWHAEKPTRAFTDFNHAPHLLLQMDCAQCHPYAGEADEETKSTGDAALAYLDSFVEEPGAAEMSFNPHAFQSNFEPIAKDTCVKCHTGGKAGNSCLICHNYHVQDPPVLQTPAAADILAAAAPEG